MGIHKEEARSCSDDVVSYSSRCNGLLISNILIPEEIIAIILNFLPWQELLPCRLVCQTWKDIVESSVCLQKIRNNDIKNLVSSKYSNDCSTSISSLSLGHLPFYVNYTIGTRFGKNLLKNPFGNVVDNKFDFWEVLQSGGHGWEVEEIPVGANPLPETLDGRSCFATSYDESYKEQEINLKEIGFHPKVMDEIQPDIKISEWYAPRVDCGSKYKINVSLLNENHERVAKFRNKKRMQQWQAPVWNEISYTFSNYGPGVRYILFGHGGCDTQFWAGHYGSKMAGGKVVALVPQRILRKMSD